MNRRAKIVATLGPASSSEEVLTAMFEAGLDVVRLNLSHGSHEDHRALIRRVRRLAAERDHHVPIVLDLMGPRYRLGTLGDGVRILEDGERLRLVGDDEVEEGSDALPVGDPKLLAHMQPGERVLIDNGLVELQVEGRSAADDPERGLLARVLHGGRVATRKGINLPDTSMPFEISSKDRADVAFGVAEGVDYLAASYVHHAEDLEALRRESEAAGRALPLIAKLERPGSIDRLEELVEASDAVMVARGDLGVEVPLHKVPTIQKRILAEGRRWGRPVIVATQMLESMMHQPRPTRAEASDVANAVLDGADALMLSGETAAGSHPVEAVAMMARIIEEAEQWARKPGSPERIPTPDFPAEIAPPVSHALKIAEVVSAAGVYAAERIELKRIVAFSQGGFTARMVARNRPEASILVFTTDETVARRIQLVWGVQPLVIEENVEHHDEVVEVVARHMREKGLAEPGEIVAILQGEPIKEKPLTNLLRLMIL